MSAAGTTLSPRIFISYSHEDKTLVAPVVEVLRASGNFVYLDSDSIRPGRKWREELEAAIANSDMVMLFWCEHSEASVEVGKEVGVASARGKGILPLLMDSTALPPALAEFQYIDFRAAFGKTHNPPSVSSVGQTDVRNSAPSASAPKLAFAAPLLSTALMIGAVFVLTWLADKYLPSPWQWAVLIAILLLVFTWALGTLKGGGRPPLALKFPPKPESAIEPDAWVVAGQIEQELQRKLRPG